MERGLHASRWARTSNSTGTNSPRYTFDDDWTCSACRTSNFDWRTRCYRCDKLRHTFVHTPGLANRPEDEPAATNGAHDLDVHIHNGVEEMDVGDSTAIDMGNGDTLSIDISAQEAVHHLRNKGGLTTSRWAPRHGYNDRNNHDHEIWTRTISIDTSPSSNTHNNTTSTTLNPPLALDLDTTLPYRVQHTLLSLLQRTMEESCFSFAQIYIPQYLESNKIDCVEAAELATWRRVLPEQIDQGELTTVGVDKLQLEKALGWAARIRNAAVHRHLCTVAEVIMYSGHARHLLQLLDDSFRAAKIDILISALELWKDGVMGEAERRNKLEEALQCMQEAPLEVMDWTPNSVGLAEVRGADYGGGDAEVDEMEVD